MPLIQKPVAFDSINFLPGFPSLSTYDCNPWQANQVAGACASGPISISRQPTTLPASVYWQRAMLGAGVAPAVVDAMMRRGVVPAALAGIVPQLRGTGTDGGIGLEGRRRGMGSSAGSLLEGLGMSSGALLEGLSGSGSGSGAGGDGGDADDGCGCGGHCGGCGATRLSGMGFALSDITANPMAWLQSNAVPLAIGAAAVWFFFKRR